MSHNHLHPKEVGLIRMLQVVVWSEDLDLVVAAKKLINDEFGEYIFLIDVENLSVFEDLDAASISQMIAKYDYHLIKLSPNKAELIFRDESKAQKIEREFEDLEELIEDFSRKLIAYYHQNMEDD